jgi:hypothetical protein
LWTSSEGDDGSAKVEQDFNDIKFVWDRQNLVCSAVHLCCKTEQLALIIWHAPLDPAFTAVYLYAPEISGQASQHPKPRKYRSQQTGIQHLFHTIKLLCHRTLRGDQTRYGSYYGSIMAPLELEWAAYSSTIQMMRSQLALSELAEHMRSCYNFHAT